MKVAIVLIPCIFLASFSNLGKCCGPAEIGQKYTITSTASVPSDVKVMWQLNLNSGTILYDSSQVPPDIYKSYTGNRNQLTINNVSKNEGGQVFQQVFNNVIVYNCTLPVYKRASTPTCENVILTQQNQIRTTCTTAQVFPQAKCQFTLQIGGTATKNITDGTSNIAYTHTTAQGGYNSMSCTLQYPVDGLKPGNWTVQVSMYPDLTGVSLAQGTVGPTSNTLRLSVPTVNIDPNNCPKGLAGEGDTNVRNSYIRQGERASCECTQAHAGNPPGTIGWSSTQGGNFAVLSQSADAASIQINSPGTFTCRSVSVLDGSHSTTYTPKYAYGPSSAFLTFQRPGPIYLCPNQQTNINITCQVPANSFNPATLFTIQDSNSKSLVTKVAGDTALSKSVNYNFTKSGEHTFTCRVENAIFSDILSNAPASAIQVYAPPNSPPSLQITGQSVITDDSETWVKQGSDISVSCSAGEAYPLVNSVNVTCGQSTSSSISSRGQLSVSGVSGDELKCQCAVDHETKGHCNDLNLTKNITIKTAYGPKEVTLSLAGDKLNEPLKLCSSEGLDVTVICAVKRSDVRPSLTLADFALTKPNKITTKQTYLDTLEEGIYKSVNKLNVTSGGNHTLVCEARNRKFSDMKNTSSMILEVREPPRERPKITTRSSQNGDVLVEGDDVTVICEVSGGYPAVQSVTLTCGQDESVTSNGTSAILTLKEIGLKYNSTDCKCQAKHVTECYDLKSTLPLIIIFANSTQLGQEDSPPIGAAVGGAIGAFVLIAVVAGVIFFIWRGRKKKEAPRPDTKGYDPYKDPKAVIRDNAELYGTASDAGYDPHKDPTAVFTDNSELYASAASKGYDPKQDPTAVFRDNSELYASAASQGYDPHKDPTAVFVDNSELYASASKGYDPHQDPTAVFRDNSELYGSASKVHPVSASAKNYKDLQPTIASATAVPKIYRPESGDNPYEEVNTEQLKMKQKMFAKDSKTGPAPPAKPKPAPAQKPTLMVQPNHLHNESVGDVYTTVVKVGVPASSTPKNSDLSDDTMMVAPTEPPEVPAKLYTQEDLKEPEDEPKDKKKKKKSKDNPPIKKKKKKGKDEDQNMILKSPKTKAGTSPTQDAGQIYFNEAFDESDNQPYANMESSAQEMKSLSNDDDGRYRNEDGLLYTTIEGIASRKGVQTPVHHPRKEKPVDYSDIDFEKIVVNREGLA